MMRGPIGGGGQQQQGANINNNTHNSNSSNSAQMHSSGGFHGPGNRSMGQRPLSMGSASPTIGQKRDSSGFSVMGGSGGSPNFHHGSPRQAAASPDSADGNFAKLFVGSVPRTVTEDDIRPLFDEHGNVLEVALIKDKRTGQQQGCCFIKYATIEEADRAIRALHNQRTLPGGIGPIQVRYADGERERLVEYKLFVGSLNKQATEKEIEEIFAPYGRVDDVYIMRDEEKQSRGCAFVKYPSRDMAMAAVTALSGIFTMKGCDQPLTVRFADPKRHKPGDTRSGPAYGGPGFGPRPHGPIGARHGSGSGGHMGGRGPHTNWRPMGTPNMGAPAHAGSRSYGSPLTPRGGSAGASSTMGGTVGGPGGPINGSLQGAGMGAPASQQQSFNPPLAHQQIQAYGQQPTSLQKPLQMQQQLAPSMQQQHQQPQQSYSQVQQSQQSIQQFGQHLQSSQPAVQQQPSLGQLSSSQQSLSLYGQPPVSQPQMQSHVSPALQQLGPSLQQQHHLPIASLQQQKQQQVPQSQPQPQVQPQPQQQQQPQQQLQQQQPPQQLQQQQPPQQLQQQQQPQQQLQQPQHISIPQQAHSAQPSFQSQQYPYLQQQHQFHLVQPAAHSQQQAQAQAQAQAQPQPQPVQTQKQQTYYQVAAQPVQQQPSWALPTQSQTVVSTPAIASAALASSATPVVPVVSAPTPAPLTCNWSEHTSPEGYKYYYNSVTGESKWEKPEEFAAYEQQQQQLQLQQAPQQPQPQPQPQPQVQAQPQVQSQPQPQSQVQHQPQGQAQPQVQPQSQPINQAQQLQQLQPRHQQTQLQQPALTTTYTGPGMVAHQPIQQNLGYGQLQGVNAILEPIRHQVQQHSGIPAMQDYMWKQKPAGT